jgi:predicted alpha/beta-fold hydrolase
LYRYISTNPPRTPKPLANPYGLSPPMQTLCSTPLQAAAAVSVPLDLGISSEALNVGFSRLYQRHLLRRMKKSIARKFDQYTAAFDWHKSMAAKTFAEFDDLVTAPLHGFEGKDDYYKSCSATAFLSGIERPTLIVNSLDDPFMSPELIPDPDQLSDCVTLELSEAGGHVGFVEGGTPLRPKFYLPGRVMAFLQESIDDAESSQPVMPGL